MPTPSGSSTGSTKPACEGADSLVEVIVREDALGATSGEPIPYVALSIDPVLEGVKTTDKTGKLSFKVPCSTSAYSLKANKLGFEPRELQVLPNQAKVEVSFTLVRSVDYQFVTVTVVDVTSSQTLADVVISVAGAGDLGTFFTGAAGTRSFPFPRSVSQRVSFSREGYHTYAVDYWPTRQRWSPVEGLGRAVASDAGFTVKMADEGVSQLAADCTSGAMGCGAPPSIDFVRLCVDGVWTEVSKCPPNFPYCDLGVCNEQP